MLRRHAGTVVADFQAHRALAARHHSHADFTAAIECLRAIQEEVEECLAQQLFIGLDAREVGLEVEVEILLLEIEAKGADDLRGDGVEGDGSAADFARA